MKRELAFALEIQSQLTEPLGRTRASNPQPTDSESDVSIEQNRARISRYNGISVYRRKKRFKTSKPEDECVITEESNGNLVTPTCEAKEEEAPRRFTRSALKLKVDDSKIFGGDLELGDGDSVVSEIRAPTASVSGTPTKKLELKMSKKIALKKRPTTVIELFETGFLEGYPVFYNGGKKGIVLRGVIRDNGILCCCSLCKGSRVVPPSKFEIHACKSYRRAAQYICLENGKSLLEVVKACKKSSLEMLEETIQSVVGPLSVKDSIICRNCKGSYLPTCTINVGQLCHYCINSTKLQSSTPNTAVVKARTSKLVLKSSESAEVCISSRERSQRKIKRKSSEPALAPTSPVGASVHILSQEKSQWKIKNKSSRSSLVPRSSRSASARILLPNKSWGKMSEKLVSFWSSNSASTCISPPKKSQWKITTKDLRMHKLVFEEGGLPDGTEVAYYSWGKKLLEGYKKGSGIFCNCCKCEVSPSQFEAHAGWASRRKPYGYIYTSNGVSLHELAISLLKGRKYSSKDNDDLCIICADGGKLLLCDGCPRAFHKECASLESIPRGKWYCKYCQNMFQREKFVEHSANAVAAGRVSGVDPIEQITKRCIRTVKNPEEAEVIACVLCRGYDFSKSGFGPRTVILCDQCEKEYHVGCLKKQKMADLKELPKGKWFCCMDCRRIYSALQNLLICGAEKLPESLLDVIRKKDKEKGSDSATDFDVRWRLLSGKIASRETRLLLSQAVAIFHDCFDPIVDFATGRDLIPSMVYGRNIRGQDLGGMYCAILTVNSSVVSAGILRVFGSDIAELPLVATSNGNQGKGYFQLLFSCIEKLLAFLNVKTFVLPAADVAESIWTEKFRFKKIPPEQLSDYLKTCRQMMTFKGTSMLEKVVPQCRIIRQDSAAFDASVE